MKKHAPAVLYVLGAVGIFLANMFPLWRMVLYFPMYPQPMQVVAYTSTLMGDMAELDIVDDYIGVKFPHNIPELNVLPKLLYVAVALVLIAALVKGTKGLWLKGGAIVATLGSLGWALFRINGYLGDFGAHPDPNAPLHNMVKPFKPPLIGSVQLLQVKATAQMLYGTFVLSGAILLLVIGFYLALRQQRQAAASLAKEVI